MTKELINQINRKSNDEYNTNSRENMIQCTAILISSVNGQGRLYSIDFNTLYYMVHFIESKRIYNYLLI